MRLERLILQDFLTYDFLDYEFPKVPLLIQGINLTDDGQQSNGSGKSGLQTGIEFCITASNSRDVRDKELISFGKEGAIAQLYASCDVRKETLHIDWRLNIKGSNKLSLRRRPDGGEWEDVSFSNVNDGKAAILKWFEISKEDLFNYYIINKSRFKSFFKSPNSSKVELINRFSDASIVDGLEKVNDSTVQELEAEERKLEKEIENKTGAINNILELIEEQENRDFEAEKAEAIRKIEEESEQFDEDIEEQEEEIEGFEEEIEKFKEDIKQDKDDLIATNFEIEQEEKNLADEEDKISDIEKDITKAKKLVDSFKVTDWSAKREKFEQEQEKQLGIDTKAIELSNKFTEKETECLKIIQEVSVKLSGLSTCPKCKHKYIQETSESKEDLEERRKLKEKEKIDFQKKIETVQGKRDSIKKVLDSINLKLSEINEEQKGENEELNSLREAFNKFENTLTKQQKEINSVKERIAELEKEKVEINSETEETKIKIKEKEVEIKSAKSKIKNLEEQKKMIAQKIKDVTVNDNKELIKGFKEKLKIAKKELEVSKKQLEKASDKTLEQKQWSTNFKSFKMFIANRSLEIIQSHCNRFLRDMGSDLKVIFEGYKVLASGKIKDEITTHILRDSLKPFSSFSGGEQGRLLFASILANRYMINSVHPYGGLDFLSIDEVFEGVDNLGLRNIIKSAEDLEICVMFITHATEENISDNVLKIVKRNGISKIEK